VSMAVELDCTVDSCSDASSAATGCGVAGVGSLLLDRREESASS